MDYVIRQLQPEDEPILWDMVLQALQDSTGAGPSRDVLQEPEIARYVQGWPRADDIGFLAADAETQALLGAAWIRVFGEGADATPALAFSVSASHRRRGIGAALLTQLVRATPQHSVILIRTRSNNPAVRLYERFGFRIVDERPDSVVMRRDTGEQDLVQLTPR